MSSDDDDDGDDDCDDGDDSHRADVQAELTGRTIKHDVRLIRLRGFHRSKKRASESWRLQQTTEEVLFSSLLSCT